MTLIEISKSLFELVMGYFIGFGIGYWHCRKKIMLTSILVRRPKRILRREYVRND